MENNFAEEVEIEAGNVDLNGAEEVEIEAGSVDLNDVQEINDIQNAVADEPWIEVGRGGKPIRNRKSVDRLGVKMY